MVCYLDYGSTGEKVKTIQRALQKKGYYKCCVVDGKYLTYTVREVKKFQSNNGLIVDGCVGCQTWPVLVGTPCPWETKTETKTSSSANLDKEMSQYLNATKNCNINHKSITGLASTLNDAKSIFLYVRDKLSYDWYYNTIYGAVGTLVSKKGNCCDLSHLIVALCRAKKIPARYWHGKCKFSKITTGHVVSQAYVDGKWVSLDATNNSNQYGQIGGKVLTTYNYYSELPF